MRWAKTPPRSSCHAVVGALDPDLARNATSDADGSGTMRLPLSETEGKLRWKVTVRDVLTGMQGQAQQP